MAPDDYVETFTPPRVWHETQRKAGSELTFVEYSWDPDPNDTQIETVYVFFFQEGGALRVEVDRHVTGLFSIGTWERLLIESGFQPERIDYPYSENGSEAYLWICTATTQPLA